MAEGDYVGHDVFDELVVGGFGRDITILICKSDVKLYGDVIFSCDAEEMSEMKTIWWRATVVKLTGRKVKRAYTINRVLHNLTLIVEFSISHDFVRTCNGSKSL